MQQVADSSFAENNGRATSPKAVVVIGASTGGPAALSQILPRFPRSFPAAIVVVQHMRPGFIKLVARHIDTLSELEVEEVQEARPLTAGAAFFAPADCEVLVQSDRTSSTPNYTLTVKEVGRSIEHMRRRLDNVMAAAAKQFGSHTIGVLLTGVGDTGRAGLKEIRDQGGKTIAQDEPSSVVFDMPRAAIEAGVVDEVVPLWSIADRVIEIVGEF